MAEKTKVPFGTRVKKFFKDYKSEIKKITWSSRKDTLKNTGITLAVVVGAGIAIGVLDFVLTSIILAL